MKKALLGRCRWCAVYSLEAPNCNLAEGPPEAEVFYVSISRSFILLREQGKIHFSHGGHSETRQLGVPIPPNTSGDVYLRITTHFAQPWLAIRYEAALHTPKIADLLWQLGEADLLECQSFQRLPDHWGYFGWTLLAIHYLKTKPDVENHIILSQYGTNKLEYMICGVGLSVLSSLKQQTTTCCL